MKRRIDIIVFGLVTTILVILIAFALPSGRAARLFAPPGPPGTPTGGVPTAFPPFDVGRLSALKTPVGGIDPGDEADTSLAPESEPTLAPLNVKTPSTAWKTYTDTKIGFSFGYPQNWNLYPPSADKAAQAPEGTDVILQNFDDVETRGAASSEQLKVELVVRVIPDSTSLTEWVAKQQQISAEEEISYSTPVEIQVDNVPGIRWLLTSPYSAEPIEQVVVQKGSWRYSITAYPASSSQLEVFDKIINTLKFQ